MPIPIDWMALVGCLLHTITVNTVEQAEKWKAFGFGASVQHHHHHDVTVNKIQHWRLGFSFIYRPSRSPLFNTQFTYYQSNVYLPIPSTHPATVDTDSRTHAHTKAELRSIHSTHTHPESIESNFSWHSFGSSHVSHSSVRPFHLFEVLPTSSNIFIRHLYWYLCMCRTMIDCVLLCAK